MNGPYKIRVTNGRAKQWYQRRVLLLYFFLLLFLNLF
uniref:Uncharacterized protein n=1 Tax=Anguilla anguilla TaxID=7936 RepID=A0A0E9QV84_ANGAN